MNYEIYKECSLYKSFIYQRYVSELADFYFKPNYGDTPVYTDSFIVIHKEDELWWQESTFNSNGFIIPVYKFSECYISNNGNDKVFYINYLLDDDEAFIHTSCGTWIGNTNTKERITAMKSSSLGGKEYTLALKRIWGFEPDLAESATSVSKGIINGFSKKKYSVLVYTDSNDDVYYIPTVKGVPLDDSKITQIIEEDSEGNPRTYPNSASGTLFVSD